MPRRTVISILCGGILCLVLVCGGLGFALRRAVVHLATPEAITWDFRHGRSLAAVHWPASNTGTVFKRKGNFDLTIIYKDGEEFFHERVQDFICERKGDKVGNIYLHFDDGCNADQAYQILKKLMGKWNLEAKNFSDLDKWYEGHTKRVAYGDFVRQHLDAHDLHDFYPALYPGFDAGFFRALCYQGQPENGDCKFILSATF